MKISRIVSGFVGIAFLCNTVLPGYVWAQGFRLPAPGVMIPLSQPIDPPVLKGIKVNLDNPFHFDFIMDKGDSALNDVQLKDESNKLIKYFLAGVTTPGKDLWVNLSPYEKDRIVPEAFGKTEMGRDLLAEDYILKQITASLLYPEGETGKKFWKRVYEQAAARFGTTDIPVDTFNKVWIAPEKAVIYENSKTGTAYITESRLKVMLEQDYVSLQNHAGISGTVQIKDKEANQLGSQIVREIIIPELVKEVNEGSNFAQLRQVYNSLILSTWYKKKIKDGILSRVYADKNKVAGVSNDDPFEKQKIYQQYLQAFEKGVYNYIKEETDPVSRESVPRKYFSGGTDFTPEDMDGAMDVRVLAAGSLGEIKRTIKKGVNTLLIIAAGIVMPSLQAQTAQAENIISTQIEVGGYKGQTWTFNDGKDTYVGGMVIQAPPPIITNLSTGKKFYPTSLEPFYSYDQEMNVVMPSGSINIGLQEYLPSNQAVVIVGGHSWPMGEVNKLFINKITKAGYFGDFKTGSIVTELNTDKEYWVGSYYPGMSASGYESAKLINPPKYVANAAATSDVVQAATSVPINSKVSLITMKAEYFAVEGAKDNFYLGPTSVYAPVIYTGPDGVKYFSDKLTEIEFVNGQRKVNEGIVSGNLIPFSSETASSVALKGWDQPSGYAKTYLFMDTATRKGFLFNNFAVGSFGTQLNVVGSGALFQVASSGASGNSGSYANLLQVKGDLSNFAITFQSPVKIVQTNSGKTLFTYYDSKRDVTLKTRGLSNATTTSTLKFKGSDGVFYKGTYKGSVNGAETLEITPVAFLQQQGETTYAVALDGSGAKAFINKHTSDVNKSEVQQPVKRHSTVLDWIKRNAIYAIPVGFASWGISDLFHGDTKSLKVGATVVTAGSDNKGDGLPVIKGADNVPTTDNAEKVGGIDLTAEQMNLQLQNAGQQIEFRVDPAMLTQLQNVAGFTSNVIGMQIMTEASLSQFLGV